MEKTTQAENPLKTLSPDGGMTAIFPKLGIVGDSMASGEIEIVDPNDPNRRIYLDYYEYAWGQFIARKCGITARIFARGGLTAKTFDSLAWSTMTYSPDNACNAYVVALGCNDIFRIHEYADGFGTEADLDAVDPKKNKDSFIGWYDRILRNLRNNVPDCPIFAATIPRGLIDETSGLCEKHAAYLRSLPARFKNLYVIDFRKYAPVCDEAFRQKYFLNGHMNPMGYKLVGDMIATYIDYIVMHHIDEFRETALVGKRIAEY